MIRLTRWVSLLVSAVVLASLLGACQSDSATDRDAVHGDLEELNPRGALVVYWHALTGTDEDRLLEMIDDFNTGNPWDITVVGEYQGAPETIYRRIVEHLASGKLPSMVMIEPSLALAYATHEAAVPLSAYWESDKWGFKRSERDDFFPSALASGSLPQFEGERFGFPACRSLQVLYYNVDWLKELGYDAPPQNWDEFRLMACAASNPEEGRYGFEFGMDSSLLVNILAARDVPIFDENAGAYTLGGGQGRVILDFLKSLIQNRCAQWETASGPLADFSAGEVLFTVGSSADLPTYRHTVSEGANFDWSLALLPYTTEQASVGVYGNSLAILPKTPKEKLAAWLFIKWLAEPEQQARWSQDAACFPTRQSALTVMEDDLADFPQYRLAAQFLTQQWITEPIVTAYPTCRAEIGRMIYAVTAGEDVGQWLDDTRDLCNQALEDATERVVPLP
jgi:multiple sugar transport system substrate-binding protein